MFRVKEELGLELVSAVVIMAEELYSSQSEILRWTGSVHGLFCGRLEMLRIISIIFLYWFLLVLHCCRIGTFLGEANRWLSCVSDLLWVLPMLD